MSALVSTVRLSANLTAIKLQDGERASASRVANQDSWNTIFYHVGRFSNKDLLKLEHNPRQPPELVGNQYPLFSPSIKQRLTLSCQILEVHLSDIWIYNIVKLYDLLNLKFLRVIGVSFPERVGRTRPHHPPSILSTTELWNAPLPIKPFAFNLLESHLNLRSLTWEI
jgi:hypothetical protein